ncbi:MAG: ADOP family duplicated permease [Vicinamibacterales bacterium]
MIRLLNKLRRLRRISRDDDLRAELEFHLEEEAADGIAAGRPKNEARRAARLDLGNRARVEEDVRAEWRWPRIDRLGQDLRYAARMMRRKPGLAATAIVTLALGIGGNTALFSLMDALLLRTLPVDHPQDLVRLVQRVPDGGPDRDVFTLVTRYVLQQANRTMSGVAASSELFGRPAEIDEGSQREHAFVQYVSGNYFDVLGVPAVRGRVFHEHRPGAAGEPIAVMSYDYWQRHYAGASSALGAHVHFNRLDFTIGGITPAGFSGMEVDVPVDLWIDVDDAVPPNSPDRTHGAWMYLTGRLRAGATLAQASAESSAVLGHPAEVRSAATGYSSLRRQLSQPLQLAAIVVGLVLLIACANLANLMLASTAARARELAVRSAIGASRRRILHQLVTESLVLSIIGALLGLGLASWISAALLNLLPPLQAAAASNLRFQLDWPALGFAVALTGGACVLFGLLPAIRATRVDGAAGLRAGVGTGSRHRQWLNRGLIVAQVVMCVSILMVAGVFLRTLQNLRGQDAGYRADHLLVADVDPPREYTEDRRDQILEALRTRIAALSGVVVAGFSHVGQLSGSSIDSSIRFPGGPAINSVIEQRISSGFLGAMGTPIVAGRAFTEADDQRAPLVAIVNEAFVRRFLAGESVIGNRFLLTWGSQAGRLVEVVGIVKDAKWINLRDEAPPMYYRPYRQMGGVPEVRFAIRTSVDPRQLAGDLRAAARAIDPGITVANIVPFTDIIDRTLVTERLVAQVSTAFGAIALIIAAVGLYGVLAYSVVRRRREIGVRMAIGARPRSVEWMFLRESLGLLALGIALGLPAAYVLTRLASSMLYGLGPHDPGTIAAALAVLGCATLAAAYLPAHRAARIDPIIALRED